MPVRRGFTQKRRLFSLAVVALSGAASALTLTVSAAVAKADADALVTLPALDDPLAGSETAILVGATGAPTWTATAARTIEDLYLHPLGFDGGALDSTVCDMVVTNPCAAPLQVLTTPELVEQSPSAQAGASDVVLAVENEFNANPGAFSAEHPLTIFGYSQGGGVDSLAMTQLAQDGIPSQDLHFVFIGDAAAPDGMYSNWEAEFLASYGAKTADFLDKVLGLDGVNGLVTPDDLYPATIYSLAGDSVSDASGVYNSGGINAVIEGLIFNHVEYLGLTPDEIANATTTTDGDLTFLNISDEGVHNLAAWFSELITHEALFSGVLTSLSQSLEFLLTNSY